jgi:hypothetical protein
MRQRKWGVREGRKRMNQNEERKEICMLLEN